MMVRRRDRTTGILTAAGATLIVLGPRRGALLWLIAEKWNADRARRGLSPRGLDDVLTDSLDAVNDMLTDALAPKKEEIDG